jgi:hypothetical protein
MAWDEVFDAHATCPEVPAMAAAYLEESIKAYAEELEADDDLSDRERTVLLKVGARHLEQTTRRAFVSAWRRLRADAGLPFAESSIH